LKVAGVDKPRELYILSRQLVEVLPSADNWIAGYRWLPTGEIYQPDEIIDLYYPSGDGTPAEESPTSSAVGAITRYALADRAQAAIDQRGGQGGGIVFYPDNMDDLEFNAAKDNWENIRSNPANAGRDIHVSSALKYESGALTARDQQREERAMRLINEIVAAYQCTPIKAGDYSDASKLANAAVQSREFAEEWGVEELEFIEEAFNNELLWKHWPEARDAGMYLEHDLAEIPALREDEKEKAEIRQTKVQAISVARAAMIASLNEARAYIDLPRIEDPRADQVPIDIPSLTDGNTADETTGDQTSGADTQPTEQPAQPAQSALNGAQIASLLEVITAVSAGTLAETAATEVLRASFPTIDEETIMSMIKSAKTIDIQSLQSPNAAKAEQQAGVMVALMLRPEDAQQIANQTPAWSDEGVAPVLPADYHITLAYLGDAVNFDDVSKSRIMLAAETVARRFSVPVQVTAKGAGRFVNAGGDAIWAGVAAEGLDDMQKAIVGDLKMGGITVTEDHGDYRPHITLAYVPTLAPATVPAIQPVRCVFMTLTVMWAGERYDFPFGSNETYKSVTAKAQQATQRIIADYVGVKVRTPADTGVIEKVLRFGDHDGKTATKASPLFMVNGLAYTADELEVIE
jgi:2'-5' RNA ligase